MMEQTYRKYVMDNFFVEDFFVNLNGTDEFLLEETDEGGETWLHFKVCGAEAFAILNVDKQNNTLLYFFKSDRALSLYKRVDHIVLEKREDNHWVAHLIEMKTSISYAEKWTEIKGKFRASYLFVQALCAILHIELSEVKMYTTYENVSLDYMPENMICRRPRVGVAPAVPKQEWSDGQFVLRFGQDCQLPFEHTPIQVTRNQNKILEGEFQCA